ncbi:carbohydrate kinase [Marasmius fiardii PR-910]|nr:carbohydrate kinase [Marasmius fiardii PR-910]
MSSKSVEPGASQRKPLLIIIIMGVSGTGKTTLATSLSKIYRLPYIEGDEMHPKANIDKMSAGIPLTDADREPWLELIRTRAVKIVEEQRSDQQEKEFLGVIVTCSALKSYYRDMLRGHKKTTVKTEETEGEEAPDPEDLPVVFLFLKGKKEMLLDRMTKRKNHYMKANMLNSQLETLEDPEGEENVIVLDIEDSTEDQLEQVKEGLSKLKL